MNHLELMAKLMNFWQKDNSGIQLKVKNLYSSTQVTTLPISINISRLPKIIWPTKASISSENCYLSGDNVFEEPIEPERKEFTDHTKNIESQS